MTTAAVTTALLERPPTTRTPRDDRLAIPGALRSERIKVTSLRSARVLPALAVAVNLITAWAVGMWATDEDLVVSRVFVYPTIFSAAFAAIAGILLFTPEAHHGTLASTLTAQPARWVTASTKTVTAATCGAVLGAVGMVAGVIGAVAVGLPAGDTSTIPATTVAALLLTGLAGVIGLGVGMVVRNTAGAIAGLLVYWFIVEDLLLQILPAKVGRFLPFDAGFRLVDVGGAHDTPAILAAQFDRPVLALIFASYASAAIALGTVLLYRRDSN